MTMYFKDKVEQTVGFGYVYVQGQVQAKKILQSFTKRALELFRVLDCDSVVSLIISVQVPGHRGHVTALLLPLAQVKLWIYIFLGTHL